MKVTRIITVAIRIFTLKGAIILPTNFNVSRNCHKKKFISIKNFQLHGWSLTDKDLVRCKWIFQKSNSFSSVRCSNGKVRKFGNVMVIGRIIDGVYVTYCFDFYRWRPDFWRQKMAAVNGEIWKLYYWNKSLNI